MLVGSLVLLLALLALVICVRGLSPFRARRLATGLALLSAAGLLLWASLGQLLAWPRAVVVVFSDEALLGDLEAVTRALGPNDRIAWLRLQSQGKEKGGNATWTSRSAAQQQPGEAPEAYLQRIHEQARSLSLNRDTWSEQLTTAVRDTLNTGSLTAGPWQATVVCLHDRGPGWSNLSPQAFDLPAVARRMQSETLQAYLFPVPSGEAPGHLELTLERSVVPPVSLVALGTQRAHLRLVGANLPVGEKVTSELRLWLDGGPGHEDKPHFFKVLTEWKDPVPLAEMEPRHQADSYKLTVGFHRVLAELVVRLPQATRRYTASRYFQVADRSVLFIEPPTPGYLAGGNQPGSNRLKRFLTEKNDRAQSARSELTGDLVKTVLTTDPPNAIAPVLRNCRALVLIEPTPADLQRLDRDLNLGSRVQAGLNILLIGPPVRSESTPPWLVASAKPTPGMGSQTPLRVDRQRRLFLLPEHGRLLKSPARNRLQNTQAGDATGYSVQAGVINYLASELLPGSGPLLDLAEGDTFQPYLRYRGDSQPRLGQVAGEPIQIYPPRSPVFRYSSTNEPAELPLAHETAAGHLPTRLRPLTEPTALPRPHLYPGTSVVLFSSDLPHVGTLPENLRNSLRSSADINEAWPAEVATTLDDLADLQQRGVHLGTVHLTLDPHYRNLLSTDLTDRRILRDYLDRLSENERNRVRPFPLDLRQDAARSVGADLLQWLRGQATSRLQRTQAGRVIDNRAQVNRPAPLRHYLLDAPMDLVYAEIRDDRFPTNHPLARTPAVCAHAVGEGRIITLGYSPFAEDLWNNDGAIRDQSQAHNDGWGVQRLLDLVELTAPLQQMPEGHPLIRKLTVAEDGATMTVDCWANLSTWQRGTGWLVPTLDGVPGQLQSVDPVAGTVQFRFQFSSPRFGQYKLIFDSGLESPLSQPELFLDLRAAVSGRSSVREVLGQLAGLTGGTTLTTDSAAAHLSHLRPAAWYSGMALALLTLLLFSPVLRSWAILRRRDSAALPEDEPPRAVVFDTEAVLVEWGLHPGAPQASRRAGNPAGEKPYEPGDALGAARPATLLPFTTAGRALPLKRPVMRQRIVTQAMEAFILLDCTPSLLVPGDPPVKVEYLRLLVRLLAGAVWSSAGQVRLLTAQHPTEIWGPRGTGTEPSELDQFVHTNTRAATRFHLGRLNLPEGCVAGHIVFLITDLLAAREVDLSKLLTHTSREEISLRVILLQGHLDGRQVGIGWSSLTGGLLDRGEWTPEELMHAQSEHARRMQALVESGGGRIAIVRTDMLVSDVFETLREREILA